jgi:hypothetical protein
MALMSSLDNALREFEAAEANLVKLERLWDTIREKTPSSAAFGSDVDYENAVRAYEHVLKALPKIDNWKPAAIPADINDIGQWHFDAMEVGEPEAWVAVQNAIEEPGRELREYRYQFDLKRRELVRNAVTENFDRISGVLRRLGAEYLESEERGVDLVDDDRWRELRDHIKQVDVLLGSSVPRPSRWSDLHRHLHFGKVGDFQDIVRLDWPAVSDGITRNLYAQDEPIPVNVADLSSLVGASSSGPIATGLNWQELGADGFERLLFALISNEEGYENPEWLIHTNAPDRGRDLSVTRVVRDALTGVRRERVMIQCKNWRGTTVGVPELAGLQAQIRAWEPPPVDELIVATTGRFSADAVAFAEASNRADTSMSITLWPDSHLERLLAARPGLVAEFGLRRST